MILNQKKKHIFILHGDEIVLKIEEKEKIYDLLRKDDYVEKFVFSFDKNFSWFDFRNSISNQSLFSEKSIIEIKFENLPDKKTSNNLYELVVSKLVNQALILELPYLKKDFLMSELFSFFQKNCFVVPCKKFNKNDLLLWINKRFESYGLSATNSTIELLAEKTEGNLLATKQEIEKLSLTFDKGDVSETKLNSAIIELSKFNVNLLTDALMNCNKYKFLKILTSLKSESAPPSLILWCLTQEIRNIVKVKYIIKSGFSVDEALKTYRVWGIKRELIKKHAKNISFKKCSVLLNKCLNIDKIIKNVSNECLWDNLINLGLLFMKNK